MIRSLGIAAAALALGAGLSPLAAQEFKTTELKLAHFVPPGANQSRYLEYWARQLETLSNGQLAIKLFPGSQLGPLPKYYDLAREGVADIVWMIHAGTPGRFPLTEIIALPYMVASAEVGAKVLNDRELRQKYLDPEHKGVRPLFYLTHQPGVIHSRTRPVRTAEDLKGLRVRFASPYVRDFIAALGGTPVGIPATEMVENLQKGTIDAAFIDYSGAHTAFKMGGVVKFSTDMYSYVVSFAIAMNQDSYNKLPAEMKKLVEEMSMHGATEMSRTWDIADKAGKDYLVKEGGQIIRLSAEENAKFRRIGAEVADKKLAELEAQKHPARAVHAMMRSLAERHEKTSISFWK